MAGGGQASAGAIPPIVMRVGKEVDELEGEVDFEGGLGVGGEPLLGRRAGSPKPLCLQPSSRGGEGARSWGKSQGQRVMMASSGRAGGVPLLIIFTLNLSIPT